MSGAELNHGHHTEGNMIFTQTLGQSAMGNLLIMTNMTCLNSLTLIKLSLICNTNQKSECYSENMQTSIQVRFFLKQLKPACRER